MTNDRQEEASTLSLRLDVPSRVWQGERVPIVLTLANHGRTSQDFLLGVGMRRPHFDVTVSREDGSLVWRRLAGMTIAGVLKNLRLEPEGTMEFAHVWNQHGLDGSPVPSARYLVTGRLEEIRPLVLLSHPPREVIIEARRAEGNT